MSLSSLFASGADLGTGLLSGFLNYQYSKSLTGHQMRVQRSADKWNALNLPSLQVQGLENAGINPMLAYGSLNNSAASISQGRADFDLGSPGSSFSSAHSASKQRELMDSQISESKARAALSASAAQLNSAKATSEALKPENIRALTQLALERAKYASHHKTENRFNVGFQLPEWLGGVKMNYVHDSSTLLPSGVLPSNSAKSQSELFKRYEDFQKNFSGR